MVIVLNDRFLRFPEGKAKSFTMSYDDGPIQDKRFSDVITRYGLKCTFNLNASLNNNNRLTVDEVNQYIYERGHEVAVHGANHKANGNMSPIVGIKDVLDGRLYLEEKFGKIIKGMAYPDSGITRFSNCTTYDTVKRYLRDLGIVYSRTLGSDNNGFFLPTDWYAWMPTAHHDNPNILTYLDEFINLDLSTKIYHAARGPRLFYLWGHSFEFDSKNNWEHLDEICEKISGNNEIWYATNIEIYNYINAYNSLELSADETIIYNPTLIDVWLDIDGKVYKVPSGKTIKIIE